MTAFENYSKSLDTTLPAFISQEMFDSTVVGDLSNSIAVTTAILKASYQRRWLEENGVMGELFELVTSSDNKEGAFNLLQHHQQYLEGLGASTLDFMKLAGKFVYKSNKSVQAIQTAYGTDTGGSGGGDDSGGGGDDNGGGEGDDADNGDFNPDAGSGGDAGSDTGDSGTGDDGGAGDDDNGDFDADAAGADAGNDEDQTADKDKKEDDEDNGDFKG
jgi:hypothetical protein